MNTKRVWDDEYLQSMLDDSKFVEGINQLLILSGCSPISTIDDLKEYIIEHEENNGITVAQHNQIEIKRAVDKIIK